MQKRKSNLTNPHAPIRSNKPISSIKNDCIYKTNSKTRTNYQCGSLVCPIVEERVSSVKTCSTQTSQTVITLPVIHTNRMSPDSLSPKTEYRVFPHELSSEESIGSTQTNLRYIRKQYVLRDIENDEDEADINASLFTGDTLTKVFLEKNRYKRSSASCTTTPEVCSNFGDVSTRSKFLQQTSPLRNLVAAGVKSKSFIECPRSNFLDSEMSIAGPRFKVTSVSEKQEVIQEKTEGVRFFCADVLENVHEHRSKSSKCVSFMSPTIASESKNQTHDIESVMKRISPIRKGRSVSPKPAGKNVLRTRHVPYIDKSCSTIRTTQQDIDIEYQGGEDSTLVVDLEALENNSVSPDINTGSTNIGSFSELCQAMMKLRESDWNKALLGLADIVELSRVSQRDFMYPHMTVINQRVIDLLKSSRSHVCRTTCQAVGHLFEYVKDTRRPEFDELVDVLLHKTADSNKFIRHDANLALDCMVTHIPLLHSTRALCAKGPDHKNALVRTATARLVVCAVVLAGASSILEPNSNDFARRRIILNMVRFLNDKAYETRKYGARLYKVLSKDPMFDGFLRKYLEKETVLQIRAYMKIRATDKKK